MPVLQTQAKTLRSSAVKITFYLLKTYKSKAFENNIFVDNVAPFLLQKLNWQNIRIESWAANIAKIQLANLDLQACSCIRSHRET
jgi:hypothetical protein